jgi:hypothetical protein
MGLPVHDGALAAALPAILACVAAAVACSPPRRQRPLVPLDGESARATRTAESRIRGQAYSPKGNFSKKYPTAIIAHRAAKTACINLSSAHNSAITA